MTIDVSAAAQQPSLDQMEIEWIQDEGTVWCYMAPSPRPCFTPALLTELRELPETLRRQGFDPAVTRERPCFMVFSSRIPGIFNLGGDLHLFRRLIQERDRERLETYALACIDAVYNASTGFGMPMTTIALVQGSALGGGMEAALATDVLVAERGTQMGLPEVMFNLFPGMGAYSFLSRRLGAAETERFILSGKTWRSEELYELGIVDILAEPGEGEEAVRTFIAERQRRSPNTLMAMERVRRLVNPVTRRELEDITMVWVDAALRLQQRDLKIMDRLVRSQEKAAERYPLVSVR